MAEGPTEPTSVTRGLCGICGYTARLRKDGSLGRHHLYFGKQGVECPGTGKTPSETEGESANWGELIRRSPQ